MEILINGEIEIIVDGSMLSDLVTHKLGNQINGVAIAVNHSVVPKETWPSTALHSNDEILIIKATQGG